MNALAILASHTVCSISTNFCRMTKKVQSVSYLLIKGRDLAVLSVTKLFISGSLCTTKIIKIMNSNKEDDSKIASK